MWNVVISSILLVGAATASIAGSDPFFSRWETLKQVDGLPSDKVLTVLATADALWAGTDQGLAMVRQGEIEVIGTDQGLPFPIVTALATTPTTGDLWIGTMGGLARLSGGRLDAFTQLNSGLANDVIYGVAADDQAVWIATASGLSRYELATDSWEIFDVTNTLMHEPWCYAVTLAEDNVYVAVWGGGVLVRNGRSGVFREHRDPDGEMEVDLFRDDGLVHDVTSSIAFSDDTMWVGTYFGLSRYQGRRWASYSQEDSGLPGDFINFLRSRADEVWIATDQGLGRFDSKTWHAWKVLPEGGVELRTTTTDGESSLERLRSGPPHNTIYSIDLDRQDIWLATAAGLSHGIGRAEATDKSASRHLSNKGETR
jgi:ligand-binding sensor domain-containing protein